MIDIPAIVRVVKAAGELAAQVNYRDAAIRNRASDGPSIEALLVAHTHILKGLERLTPEIPVVSETISQAISELSKTCRRYWLISSSDSAIPKGQASEQCTVCLALIEQDEPEFGFVHIPSQNIIYWGAREYGAFKMTPDGQVRSLHVHKAHTESVAIPGRLSFAAEFEVFIASLRDSRVEKVNSCIKLCLVAEGSTNLAHRMGLASKWDIAAAHAIVNAAGGQVLTLPTLETLRYGEQKGNNETPFFIVSPAPSLGVQHETSTSKDGIVYERRAHESKAEVIWHHTQVTAAMRAANLCQQPRCIWLTGLSGSGKSTIANSLEFFLHKSGRHTFLLDGDNVRQGLNKDLSMSADDRAENIRRVGEVAKLMVDAGMIVITAFISPFRADRERVRALFPEGNFMEVFVDTPLYECERRDVKGLYAKARRGELKDFTGIDSRYECPESPNVHLFPAQNSVEDCVEVIMLALNETWFTKL